MWVTACLNKGTRTKNPYPPSSGESELFGMHPFPHTTNFDFTYTAIHLVSVRGRVIYLSRYKVIYRASVSAAQWVPPRRFVGQIAWCVVGRSLGSSLGFCYCMVFRRTENTFYVREHILCSAFATTASCFSAFGGVSARRERD